MNRRAFLHLGGAAIGAALGRTWAADGATITPATWRSITYNILAAKGYPETDTNRDRLRSTRPQMVERLALELGLYNPDLITFQESPPEPIVAAIAKAMGRNHTYFPGGFPGAVISRWKILESNNCPLIDGPRPEDLFTRHWGRAVLQANGQRLTVYSAHLHPSNAEVRAREVTAALAVMAPDIASDQPMLFQGDLNHRPDGPEYPRWQEAGLVDTFDRQPPPPVHTFPSTVPVQTIDYLWANPALARQRAGARVLFEGAFRTNPDDPHSVALSDHLPVLAEFRL
jgi:endonuclease/exonuclease/phosphatase family metal-dependent hydrolase